MKLDIIFLIVTGICIIFYFCTSSNTEHFNSMNDAKAAVNAVYQADVGAIRTLADVATKLQTDGYTCPGALIIKDKLYVYAGGDPNRGVDIFSNNQDGASYNNYQGGLGSWSGIGLKCKVDGQTRHMFDTRSGNISNTGNIYTNTIFTNGKGNLPGGWGGGLRTWDIYGSGTLGWGGENAIPLTLIRNDGSASFANGALNINTSGNITANSITTNNINGINPADISPVIINFAKANPPDDESLQDRTFTLNQRSAIIITWIDGKDGNWISLMVNSRARFAALGLRNHTKAINDFRDYNDVTLTVPPGKVVKMWRWDNSPPLIFNAGYHDFNSRSINGPHFIWVGLASNYEHFPDSIRMNPIRFPW
jgi:hypothetical protein